MYLCQTVSHHVLSGTVVPVLSQYVMQLIYKCTAPELLAPEIWARLALAQVKMVLVHSAIGRANTSFCHIDEQL